MAVADIIWPWWVRLSHWLVAIGIVALWVLAYGYFETDVLHRSIGYGVLAIIALRILAACFTGFAAARLRLPGWVQLKLHFKHMWHKQLPVNTGHNPLGQWAVYGMWGCVGLLALTGWLSRTDALWGEDWPVDLHAALSFCLLGLVVMHVIAVFWVSRHSGQQLLAQMWHGRLAVKARTVKRPD